MQSVLITPLAAAHAEQATRLHIAGQPGTFLTSLGSDVLTVVYRALPQAPTGFGFAAVDNNNNSSSAAPAAALDAAAPNLLGYVSATTGIGNLFLQIGRQRWGELAPPLLRRLAQRPDLALRSVQTAFYPLLVHTEEGHGRPLQEQAVQGEAELLSIMVDPVLRSQGLGAVLLAAFLQACRRRGLATVSVTVDAANAGAQRFYQRHGFCAARTIRLYGRPMLIYRLPL